MAERIFKWPDLALSAPAAGKVAGKAGACLFLFVALLAALTSIFQPFKMDFVSFWAAASLAGSGDAVAAYDLAMHKEVMRSAGVSALLPFAYPPPFLLFLTPFGWLPYGVAGAAWIAITLGLYVISALRLREGPPWFIIAFPPFLANAMTGQTGFLTAAMFIGGMTLLRMRPFAAGLLLGCLVLKPHFGLLLPLVLVAGREWRAFAGAAASSALLCLVALMAYGWASYAAWLHQAPLFASIVSDGLSGWHRMASVYAALRLGGLPEIWAWAIHGAVAFVAAVIACSVWRNGKADAMANASALAAATALASPYFYLYDAMILILPFLWLWREKRNRFVLSVLWLLLLAGFAQNWILSFLPNPAPAVSIALMILIWRQSLAEGGFSASASETLPLPRRAGFG